MTTLAIDIGGTKIAAAVCDENDSIIQRWRVPTPMDADAINQHIAEVYREAVAAGHTDIEAIGISAAGNVSADRKTLTFSANIPAWINYDLSEHVGALIDHAVPVVVENDANCAGWGEYVHGAGQGSSNMVALTVGTGLGGAIVINGQLYRGSFGMAGRARPPADGPGRRPLRLRPARLRRALHLGHFAGELRQVRRAPSSSGRQASSGTVRRRHHQTGGADGVPSGSGR